MSRELTGVVDEVETKRYPRKLITLWTFGRPEALIREDIIKDVVPHYPQLLEVFNPTKVVSRNVPGKGMVQKLEPATPGYLYIKVCDPSYELFDALKRVRGVGGTIPPNYDQALTGMTQRDIQKLLTMLENPPEDMIAIAVDTCVVVCSGVLEGSRGRVEKVDGSTITVRTQVLGRSVPIDFTIEELRVEA